MKDIKVKFNLGADTRLNLKAVVEGKDLYQQKYLINTVTSANSDPIFPERGTTLLQQLINGAIISREEASHAGAFAAINTDYFCTYEEHKSIYESGDYVMSFSLIPINYNNDSRVLSLGATFMFSDGTQSDPNFNITDNS